MSYIYTYVVDRYISKHSIRKPVTKDLICLEMFKSRLTQQQEYVLRVIQQQHKTTKVLGFRSHKIHYVDVIIPTRLIWSSPRFIRRVCP